MAIAIIFLICGKMIEVFPFFIFAGLAPVFALFNNRQEQTSSKLNLHIRIFVIVLVVFLVWNINYVNSTLAHWLIPVVHALAVMLAFVAFDFTDKYARNRIGFFTLAIYWLAVEFLLLRAHPEFSRFFLATAFNSHPEVVEWNAYTGFLGVSLWIIFVNILLYRCIFKDNAVFTGNINWIGLAATIIVACAPFFIDVEGAAILREDLLVNGADAKQLAGSGEYIGKTAVWVTVLLLLYSFVKREVSKNDRT